MIHVVTDVTLSKTISADPIFSFWFYDEMMMVLVNEATMGVLTQTPEGLKILPEALSSEDSSQKWTLDFNGEIFSH